MRRRLIIAGGSAILLLGALALFFGGAGKETAAPSGAAASAAPAPEEPAVQVEVALAAEETLAATVQLPGTVISRNDARLATEVEGKIVWIADVGAELAEGGVVARLDDRIARLEVREAEATVARIGSSVTYERREVERLGQLLKTEYIAQSRYDEKLAARDMRVSELAEARARLEQARHRLALTEIKVPFAGRVSERLAQLGEYAHAGAPLARVVDLQNREIRVQAPIGAAPYLAVGTEVQLSGDAGSAVSPVTALVPVGDQVTRTFEVRIAVPEGPWIIGAAVKVDLPMGAERTEVTVPRDALVLRPDAIFVYRVDKDSRAERIEVTPGVGRGERVAVGGGIAAGDRLIVRGAETLGPGRKVAIGTES